MLKIIENLLIEDKNKIFFNLIGKVVERVLNKDPEKKFVCDYEVKEGHKTINIKGEIHKKPKVIIHFNTGYNSPNWPTTMAVRERAENIMNEVQDKILSILGIYVEVFGQSKPNCKNQENNSILESELPVKVRRRINYDEENIINLLKKFALRHSGLNKKIHIIVRMTCKDVAYELLDATQVGFGDKEFLYVEDVLTEYLEEKYGEQLKEFIENFFDESGDELGSRYVFQKHSERNGGNGFTEGYETWNMLLKAYSSLFPDLDWKELKMKLDNMSSGGKILIKKPGDRNNIYNYYFSLQRFDVPNTRKREQNEQEITERCWKGYTQKGMKTMFGKRYPNCVKKTK